MGRNPSSTIGTNSTALGYWVTASGNRSHAEGEETIASGKNSHAEGYGTIANIPEMHVSGKFNKVDPNWTSGKSYSTGDRVVYNGCTYKCKTANSDSTWNSSNWEYITVGKETVFVIGNGSRDNNRSNAFVI